MDNICHTLAGAALGEAGLKRMTRFGSAVLMVSANLPDVDALAFLTDTPSVAIRRGWTHGVLAQALLPVLFTAIVLLFDRWRPPRDGAPRARASGLLLLGYAGVLSHVALDWLNTYGVRLLMPFSGRWFYGDSMFIIDPVLWLLLGGGVYLSRKRARPARAQVALALAALYITGMVASAAAARRIVADAWTAAHGRPPASLMVGPVPLNPLRKNVIVDAGTYYQLGTFTWWPHRVAFEATTFPRRDAHPAVVRAKEEPPFRSILIWSRFPYYELSQAEDGTRVTLRDMRFGARLGSASVVVP